MVKSIGDIHVICIRDIYIYTLSGNYYGADCNYVAPSALP